MILLCGIPTEGPMELVTEACETLGLAHRVVNQRAIEQVQLEFWTENRDLRALIFVQGEEVALEAVTGIYLRTMDERFLPEVRDLPEFHPERSASRDWHERLLGFCEVTAARVANPSSAMASNASKTYQAQSCLAQGFSVPETLVTNDPELVLEFRSRYGRLIFKSVSGVRSIVRELADADLARLERIRRCPTQFQELVEGRDIRVHTVGETVIATGINSASVDYRYAAREGSPAGLEPVELDDEVSERCVALAASLGLPFSGIDLRLADDGRVICFEVNPSPAYSYYESHTGQPISKELARWLAAG